MCRRSSSAASTTSSSAASRSCTGASACPRRRRSCCTDPGIHGNPSTNLTADDGSSPVRDANGTLIPSTNNLSLAWFDHWLKGKANGVDSFPTVETYQQGSNQWHSNPGFPYAAEHYQPWYLGASPSGSGAKSLYDGSLATLRGTAPARPRSRGSPLTGACSRSTTQWTAGPGGGGQLPSDDTSAQITGLTFTSPTFTQRVRGVGTDPGRPLDQLDAAGHHADGHRRRRSARRHRVAGDRRFAGGLAARAGHRPRVAPR